MRMLQFTDTLHVDASPAQVFSILDDLDQTSQWIERCIRVDKTSAGPNAIGTTFQYHYMQAKTEGCMDGAIVARVPDNHLGFRFTDQMMVVDIDITSVTSGTRATSLTFAMQLTPKGIGKLLSPIIKRRLPERATAAMVQLKALAESR